MSKFRNKVLIGVAIYLVIFSQEVLFLMAFTDMPEPGILIGSVFGAGLGEFGILAWIRQGKLKSERRCKDEGTDNQ
jgi:hypothetical protein